MSKKQETRNKIMKVALQLFSEQGYYVTTTKQIAKVADINEITLFRHFGTKEKLFQETTENYVREINIKHKIERLYTMDFQDSISEIANDYLQLCLVNKKLFKIQMRLSDDEKDFVKLKLSREFMHELEVYFKTLLNQGKINGEPHTMAVTFISSILGVFTVFVLTNDTFTPVPIEKLVDEYANQFATFYKVNQ